MRAKTRGRTNKKAEKGEVEGTIEDKGKKDSNRKET